jgi:hypothetical protein
MRFFDLKNGKLQVDFLEKPLGKKGRRLILEEEESKDMFMG